MPTTNLAENTYLNTKCLPQHSFYFYFIDYYTFNYKSYTFNYKSYTFNYKSYRFNYKRCRFNYKRYRFNYKSYRFNYKSYRFNYFFSSKRMIESISVVYLSSIALSEQAVALIKPIPNMLTLQIATLLASKGIDKPYSWLKKIGVGHNMANKLLNKSTIQVPINLLNTICEAAWCTPSDLFEYTPDANKLAQPKHPLHQLSPKPTPTIADKLKKLSPTQLQELEADLLKKLEE